jgi:hypothetical protein
LGFQTGLVAESSVLVWMGLETPQIWLLLLETEPANTSMLWASPLSGHGLEFPDSYTWGTRTETVIFSALPGEEERRQPGELCI